MSIDRDRAPGMPQTDTQRAGLPRERACELCAPDLHSPLYLRKQAGAVSAAFGASAFRAGSLQRLATSHVPIGQAVLVGHPGCRAGDFKHMFNAEPSGLMVSGTAHFCLSNTASEAGDLHSHFESS